MAEDTMATTGLAERVAALEAQGRRQRWLCLVLAVALGGFVLAGADAPKPEVPAKADPKIIETSLIRFVTADGKRAGRLLTDGKWRRLELLDDEGRDRIALSIVGDGEGLTFFNRKGAGSAALRATDKTSQLLLCDPQGRARIRLTVDDGGPMFEMLDENGKVLFSKP
ncbi:MAG: hypothetical protein K2R98_16355 [Gemmataceae bacterium]|nr:hypothetical protein [Gemmataceae bacterium]